MKVLLIQPSSKHHICQPPLGLGYIASFLEKEGHKVAFLDLDLHRKITPSFKGYDLIGITAQFYTIYNEAKSLIKKIRDETDAPVVLGGPHVSAMPQRCLSDSGADYVVCGEGELTIAEVAKMEEPSRIRGLAYLERGVPKVNEPRPPIDNLDILPFPAWHLMPPKSYSIIPLFAAAKRFPVAPIITSRGCPFACSFCAAKTIWGRRWRCRSAGNVVDEIQLLMEKYGVRELQLVDDNFTLNKTHALNVCNEILRRKLDISWGCPNGVRIDCLDMELLRKMKRAGCHLLCFGIESGSPDILRKAEKNLKFDLIPKVVDMAKEVGMTTMGSFIIGLPGETPETVRQTVNFAKKLKLDRAWFNTLIPLPGSTIWETEELVGDDWENFYVNLPTISRDEIIKWQKKATFDFYLRPKILFSLLRNLKLAHFKRIIAGWRWTEKLYSRSKV